MKTISAILLCILTQSLLAQTGTVPKWDNLHFFNGGVQYSDPFSGGFNSPVFTAGDIDQDGHDDLVVFERSENRYYIYKNNGVADQISYTYKPEWEAVFPKVENFVKLVDYNFDGAPDLFTYSQMGGGVDAYRGHYDNGLLSFDKVVSRINYINGSNMYVDGTKLPDFGDVNGDGDMDMVTFGQFGQILDYYENQAVEFSFSKDSLKFKYVTNCYGAVCACDPNDPTIVISGYSQGCFYNLLLPPGGQGGAEHVGSGALALTDYNKDGKTDVIMSEEINRNITLLLNKKINGRDSLVQEEVFFPQPMPVNMRVMPAPYLLDVNNDGKKDLVVAPYDVNYCALYASNDTAANVNNTWLYLNKGTAQQDSFVFYTKNFMKQGTIDLGEGTHPAFFDYNADGKLDLVVGKCVTVADTAGQFNWGLTLFENTGSTASPEFTLVSNDYAGLSILHLYSLSPTFGDIDKDGDEDMLIGTSTGSILWFKNTAGQGQPATFDINYVLIDTLQRINANATPQLVDVNKDGYLDVISGTFDGRVYYFENLKTSTPTFKESSAFWGQVLVKDPGQIAGHSSPRLADIDGDGQWELISGSFSGKVFYYDEIESHLSSGAFVLTSSQYLDNIGNRTTLAAADINWDGKVDFAMGTFRGGLELFTPDSTIGIEAAEDISANIFPNPASNQLTVQLSKFEQQEVQVRDISGRLLFTRPLGNVHITLDISQFAPGLYIINIVSKGQIVVREKVIIAR